MAARVSDNAASKPPCGSADRRPSTGRIDLQRRAIILRDDLPISRRIGLDANQRHAEIPRVRASSRLQLYLQWLLLAFPNFDRRPDLARPDAGGCARAA